MRRTAILGFSVLVATSLGSPHATSAQTIPSSYRHIEARKETGPFVGYVSANTGRFGYGPSGGMLLGARWGLELAGPVSFETTVGVIPGSRDVINPGRQEGDRVVGKADALVSTIDGRLKFSFTGQRTWKGLSPFLVFGGGVAFDLASDDPADDLVDAADRFDFGTSFYGTGGAGVRWWLHDRLTLRGDAVYQLWQLDTPPGFSTPERGFASVEESEWAGGVRFSLAVLLRW